MAAKADAMILSQWDFKRALRRDKEKNPWELRWKIRIFWLSQMNNIWRCKNLPVNFYDLERNTGLL